MFSKRKSTRGTKCIIQLKLVWRLHNNILFFFQKIDGQYCECDNFNCPRDNEQICSGPNHGRCDCGKCNCFPGWSGDACQCSLNSDTCIEPGDIMPCNGHGDCVCGKCVCNTTVARYYGRFCEKCPVSLV